MSNTLYKYRGNSEFTDKIFLEQKGWLSNAEGFNDPFECTIQEIAHDYIEQQVNILMETHILGFIQSAKIAPGPTKSTVLKKVKKAPTLSEKHKIVMANFLQS